MDSNFKVPCYLSVSFAKIMGVTGTEVTSSSSTCASRKLAKLDTDVCYTKSQHKLCLKLPYN